MARPRAGDWLEDEVENWKRSGVEMVVSLLEAEEIDDLDLRAEAPLCLKKGIEYVSFPIKDRGVPSDLNEARRFASEVASSGKTVAVHCRAGIGRSSIIAAAVLVSRGVSAEAALSAISIARRTQVPDTEAQREWVLSLDRR
ncbi:protein-tyrosine phosphatase family protein [Novosphingobium kaempferiae]|uniref:protein-tyrosine phosphatase family protein n=1 Tax=Novosphingobium kaempferiae TaxID=2896849 RepID=UPI001E62464B|nr:dual specificity protein phosphatase family protein [Novosphingobium kaempferiae]